MLNIFNMDSQPTLRRINQRLWRVGQRSQNAHTHTPIFEESAEESSESTTDSAANPLRISLLVRAFIHVIYTRKLRVAHIFTGGAYFFQSLLSSQYAGYIACIEIVLLYVSGK